MEESELRNLFSDCLDESGTPHHLENVGNINLCLLRGLKDLNKSVYNQDNN